MKHQYYYITISFRIHLEICFICYQLLHLGKRDPEAGFDLKVPRRNVGPSSTQLYMVSIHFRFIKVVFSKGNRDIQGPTK